MKKKLLKNNFGFFGMVCLWSATLVGCTNNPVVQQKKTISPMVSSTSVAAGPSSPKIPIVNSHYASLTQLNLNNTGSNEISIKPAKSVQANLHYAFHCPECQAVNYQIIVGLARRSAQACIYEGTAQAEGMANFFLNVPAKPGKYEIRYRILQAADCAEALKEGWHADNSPIKKSTIGKLIVSRKASEEILPASNKE